jgi:phospholipid-binding lipoprotein MlaA
LVAGFSFDVIFIKGDITAGVMSSEKVVDEATNGNRYEFLKSSYLQHREYLIYDGNSPHEDDALDSDESGIRDSSPPADGKNGSDACTTPINPK